MSVPWDELSLSRFLAIFEQDQALFLDGERVGGALDDAEVVEVVFGQPSGRGAKVTLDAGELARLILPTCPDYSLNALCGHFNLPLVSDCPAESLGRLFLALLEDACGIEKEVISLLVQLTEEPLSGLFGRILRLPGVTFASDPKGEPDDPLTSGENDAQDTGRGLEAGGWVSGELPSFERREGQIRMSNEVADVFREGGAIVVEAGPGTGKTFAYLIPAIERLRESEEARVIVSTRTKQLQEQLFLKDLPFLLSRMAPRLKVALLKGRENYLCLRRWELLIRELSESLERDRLRLLAPLARWLWQTETGDIDENTAFFAQPGAQELWARLCDSHLHCVEPFCPLTNDCLSTKARRKARAADLVVVNHSLLLNDLGVAGRVLGPYTHLIVDEGHALEESARSAFTATLAPRVIDRLADELTPSRRRREGFLRRSKAGADELQRATDLVSSMRSCGQSLFLELQAGFPAARRGELPTIEAEAVERADRLRSIVENVELAIEEIVDTIEDPELKKEGEGHLMAARELAELLARLVSAPDQETVRWFERDRRDLLVYFTPLEVAAILSRMLYPVLDALVLTSATLSVDGDFSYLLRTLGLDEADLNVRTVSVESPFSYADSMRLCAPANFPLPNDPGEIYASRVADLLTDLSRQIRRKGLALFTSYQLLEDVRRRLPGDVNVLAQGVDGPRTKLIERFRQQEGSTLLLGTDSFWEGVDLPGEQLEYLVVTRLPFAVPTDPVQAALSRRLIERDREPFSDLSLPRAVLRLRQGVGRLIRTRKDRGIVVLTDRRILTKSYGKSFVASLPTALQVSETAERLVDEAAIWMGEDA